MAAEKLICVGLACCLAALLIQTFPHFAFRLGVDIAASWRVFGFGVFLILMSALFRRNEGGRR
jgi:hypothetical protein